MFSTTWVLLSLLFKNVLDALCAEIDVASQNFTVSAPVTATWILDSKDIKTSATTTYVLVMINDGPKGETTEASTTITVPPQVTTGIVELIPTANGSHRYEFKGTKGSSSSFSVVNAELIANSISSATVTSFSSGSKTQDTSIATLFSSDVETAPSTLQSPSTQTSSSISQASISVQASQQSTVTPGATTPSTNSSLEGGSSTNPNLIPVILGTISGTILFILLLIATGFLILRRRRLRVNSYSEKAPQRYHDPGSIRNSVYSGYDSESVKYPRTLWNPSDFLTLTPSDSASRCQIRTGQEQISLDSTKGIA
ncbi:hypothetical protein GYMLUDRAFT_265395 [Collybiopsis luxurians FD-317 M1]|uniref:Mid2 domain-containing protein n=1 Tax=Collybiopsis luxurians FD-317 M1 TaxID=944289 RepID=A0A0D0C3U1_9AGAR|nr:hypothetical protein GYMLUDRAFT_265395 [Collybiopsis luxurians FD-317 M1]